MPQYNQNQMPQPPGQSGPGTGGGQPYTGQYSPFNDTNTAMPPPPGWGAGSVPPADYGSVQNYADDAYSNARRYLDPQQEQDNRRFQQEMQNKGIDPNSAMGQDQYEQMMRAHGDQNSGAAFDSLGFGQGIQGQMADQQLQWGNQGNARYGIDKGYDLGMGNLDMNRQGQDFGQMLDLDANQFRNNAYNDSQDQYRDQLYLAMYGQNPVPAGSTINPDGTQNRGGWGWGYNLPPTR
jgi:hypothetical protein